MCLSAAVEGSSKVAMFMSLPWMILVLRWGDTVTATGETKRLPKTLERLKFEVAGGAETI